MASNLFSRTLATLTTKMQPIARTAEGAVSISYPTLLSSPHSLGDAIGVLPPTCLLRLHCD